MDDELKGDGMAGRKDDIGKPRWDLLEYQAIEAMVRVLTQGAERYGARNWREIEDFEDRYFAALMRHITAWRQGEKIDLDSGESHLAHVLCNAMFLLAGESRVTIIEIPPSISPL